MTLLLVAGFWLVGLFVSPQFGEDDVQAL